MLKLKDILFENDAEEEIDNSEEITYCLDELKDLNSKLEEISGKLSGIGYTAFSKELNRAFDSITKIIKELEKES